MVFNVKRAAHDASSRTDLTPWHFPPQSSSLLTSAWKTPAALHWLLQSLLLWYLPTYFSPSSLELTVHSLSSIALCPQLRRVLVLYLFRSRIRVGGPRG